MLSARQPTMQRSTCCSFERTKAWVEQAEGKVPHQCSLVPGQECCWVPCVLRRLAVQSCNRFVALHGPTLDCARGIARDQVDARGVLRDARLRMPHHASDTLGVASQRLDFFAVRDRPQPVSTAPHPIKRLGLQTRQHIQRKVLLGMPAEHDARAQEH